MNEKEKAVLVEENSGWRSSVRDADTYSLSLSFCMCVCWAIGARHRDTHERESCFILEWSFISPSFLVGRGRERYASTHSTRHQLNLHHHQTIYPFDRGAEESGESFILSLFLSPFFFFLNMGTCRRAQYTLQVDIDPPRLSTERLLFHNFPKKYFHLKKFLKSVHSVGRSSVRRTFLFRPFEPSGW